MLLVLGGALILGLCRRHSPDTAAACGLASRSLPRHGNRNRIWKSRYDFDRSRGLRVLSRVTRWPSGWNVERQKHGYEDQDRIKRDFRDVETPTPPLLYSLLVHGRSLEIDQWQRVASAPRALPAKGAPNVVGTPAIVGTPVWVAAHVGVLGAADTDGVEGGVMPLSGGSKLITGAERFGFRATDGGLRPPPPISVEPSGIPVGPTVDPGPMDEAKGGDAVADAAQVVGAVALMPPPSKSAVLDSPGTELPMPPDAPVVEPPIPTDAPVIGLPIPVDAAVVGLPMAAGADEAPAHGAPIKGAAPDVVGLTPGVASSVAPRGIPVCPTGALGMPSGDVMPSAGRGETFRRACA